MQETVRGGRPARRVAVLGTGIMGSAMARNLRTHGFDVRVWNRTRAKAARLADSGAHVADTPAEAVHGADVVLTVLSDGPRVLEAMTAAARGLSRGMVWAQLSTVGVDAVSSFTDVARTYGLEFVDAPVLGTRQPAEQGQLIVMAAGPVRARPVVQPVFDAIGKRTLWVAGTGEGGASSRLKLAVNTYAYALTHGIAEAIALAEGLGVDPSHLVEVVRGGPLDNTHFQVKSAAILAGDYTPSSSVANAEHVSRLIVQAAEQAGVQADVAVAGLRRFRRAAEGGHGDKDRAASYLASFAT